MMRYHPKRLLLHLAADASLVFTPIIVAQARSLRASMPRLAEAAGPNEGLVGGPAPSVRLLVLGESTVAGIGAPTHTEALGSQLATSLAQRLQRAVAWRAVGQSGATAATVRRKLVPEVPTVAHDLIIVALGVNDSLRMRSPGRWQADLTSLITDLRARVGPAPIFLAAVPPMGHFPSLPQPLRLTLGLRAQLLDATAAALAPQLAAVTHLPLSVPVTPDQFCADGFHPNPVGYQTWANLLAAAIVPQLR
ncbi:MAG: SGNH/GDSL hydrolase family protein [Oscillochloridaceae bacterium umkhey_bin13]